MKIHGVRIELGEIEATLEGCAGVRDAVVVVWEAGPGDKRLVAWFVPDGERIPSGGELRAHLRARLSEPMVPSFFVPLPALPQTPSGKVDRKALSQLEPPREEGGEGAAPRDPTEELLAGILAEVLGRERVGIDQSFFDLGGDSLRASRVLTRIRAALGVELPHSAVLDAPTVAVLAERVRGAAGGELPVTIEPRPRDPHGEPLSLLQRRLWFIERLVPGTAASNIPIVMRLAGPLSPAVLERCLVEIAARHEALRTLIEIGPAGEPHQIVSPPAPFRRPVADLSGLPPARREEERARRIREEARRPFGPGDPLWRRLLLRVGEGDHDLLLTFHHVISDGESVMVLERELEALYAAFLASRPSPLPVLPAQPADVAAWERERLTPEALAPHLDWFREHLAGAPAALDLPADLPRPVTRSWRGRSRSLALPPDLTRAVRDLARRRGVTAYMALLASWVAFLRRITGQDDLVVGTVLAHRGRPEIEGLIGFFANSLPLRVERSGDPSFGELLAGVRAGALGLLAHQDQPLEDLAGMLRPGRASTADPLFQAFFALRGNTGQRELAPGLSLSWWEEDHGAAQFDFLLDLEDRGEEIAGRLNVSADLFTPAAVERLARGWETLLADAVARPDVPVSALALLGAAERHALLVEWSRAPRPPAWSGSVPARVAAWAVKTPDAPAVLPAEPGQPALTYGELVDRARRLAGRLRERGVGPDVRVGVYAERSPETLVGMLAVLLAGGAFLPLDPAYPPERLALILEDARVPVLLARPELAAALPTGGAEVVPLDGAVEPSAFPDAAPDGLAYVIYTSGSTGRPKGVLIPHGGFLGAVEALAERSGVEPGSRVLQFASAGFDASVWEIWSTLIRGAALVLARREDLLPGPALLATLRGRGITNVFLTPTALAALPEGASHELAALRGLVVGGEAFPPDLVARWAPGRRLWNAYGPTEASICVAMARLAEDGQTPIGRPVADSRLLVLGHHLEAVPLGVPGELHIGGSGLARGYLGRPDLTAAAFLPDPFSGPAGARLYRTGDLVRHRPDGQLEFLGRADRQVKVRGFRIEPGEIEAQLCEHPGVREAVVVPYEAAPRDLRLAAYVARTAADAATVHELRAFLRSRFPEHMVPSAFTFLDALPLSPGGKVDRRALPAPAADEAASRGSAAPRTPAEELLAGIWEEVLGRDEVGPDDDFFDLGGHSLLIGRVLARVRAAFGVDLPVRAAFEARTLAALARRIGETSYASLPPQPPLVRLPAAEPRPLSFAQQRLWLLDRLEPGSIGYNLPLAYRIEGPLDAPSLARALGEVARRHEVLRTTFTVGESGEPRPAVAPAGPVPLPRLDLSGLPAPAREPEAERLSREEAARPFDLAAGPLFRTVLVALGPARHHLLVTLHHIAFDGWSVEVFLGELTALYGAFAAGLPSPLPEPPVQYADFAAWQRRWLAGPILEAQLAYWRRQLAAAPEALDLPTDRPRPAVETSRGVHFTVPVPPAVAAGARALARGQGATLFMTLLAAFAAQLHRYTGAVDLLLGSPVANRTRGEIEGLLGFFVSTLVMRADLAGDPGFATLVSRVREMALAAYAHQDLPFERLVEELVPQRSLARSPLFQAVFVLGVESAVRELAPGLPLTPLPVDYRTAKYDLTLAVDVQEDALTATFEYRTDLLDRSTVTRWAGHFIHLLAAVAADPQAPVSTFGLLSPAERHQLALEWNDTAVLPEPAACLHQLFEAQAARTPEAVALVSPEGRERLSYRQLDERAEALARRLRALGVRPEVLAGVLMDRTVELVVSLLAVLKAGGAYVPIDPAYPRQRVATLLANSRAAVLLTRRSLLEDFAGSLPPEAVPLFVDEPGEVMAVPPVQLPQPGSLAYVIYTSGSTGEPKGVAIEHRSAVAFARWAREVYTPEERAGVLGSTSICFDISIMEIFVTLAWGGKILLAENALALPTLPARDEVTMINAVPSAMAELVRDGRLPGSVRVVNTGGEAVKGPLARRIYEASRAERVIDVYGPSEDTTYSATSLIPRDVETPAVGRPIHGTRAWVLDANLRPVPIGVPGAVYLAGDGLARGYLGRPALTAERFIPDPQGEPGARLYRVGDLARYRTDGEIEYLGRIDHQVKVRGFRIELGEIEAVLAAHPTVEKAVVATHDYGTSGAEDVRLLAWVVPAPGRAVETESLLAWVGERLPEYMVPAAVVVLDEMPLTPNGKVDRFALPTPEAREGTAAEAPRSPIEELVAGLWAETLGLSRIGLHDDFFELGGYSLLAIRLLARLRASTGLELPLRALFAHPTVAALAAEVERGLQAHGAAALPPIEPAGAGGDAPASSAQERLWYFHQLDPGGSVLNVPHPLRLTGPLDPAALAAALTEIARRHASLRASFVYGEAGLRQRTAPPAAVELPVTDLGAHPPAVREEEARRLVREEARQPFDLAVAPLWRARLLRLGEEDHRLLLTFHHTIADGWSLDLLDRELAALYSARTDGGALLPEPALQYTDFAVWQRRWLNDETLASQLAYWRRQLAGVPTVLDLPTDRPRPPRQSFRGEVLLQPLPTDLSRAIAELGRREGATLLMTALAAFAALLGRYTGREDILLGSPAANRHHPGTEGLFGFFVGNLVLRLDLSGDPTFRELLHRARQTALGAYAHPDVPFERLIEELDPARDKSRGPLVQVMLSVQPVPGEPARFAGLSAEVLDVHTDTSQFDLSLFFLDGPRGLTLEAEYATDLFERSTVERMLAQLSALLAAVVADPDLRLSALPAEIAPPTRAAAVAPVETPAEAPPPASPEEERARRQALIAERRARLAADQKELLAARLRRAK
ncbi:MAG TPA: amino acid adenylation domain-containing protein [Thermoanaerobaculia bacterium]